ncbi:hypothetical protein [Streptomyces sp. NPDC004528]|uniref:hypothetical protein n=1 Tax=Streptomyces sp. NPDC004528 TaxID=3154550 RepID=UPI0033B996CE
MSAGDASARVGRFYTAARRHPWVLGKVADFRLPLGPYTPAQIGVAVLGAVLLIRTVSWWSWMGPVPLVGWATAIWIVRRPRIAGRAPVPAAVGWLTLILQPTAGRINGRAARDRSPRPLLGGFVIEDLAPPSADDALLAARVPGIRIGGRRLVQVLTRARGPKSAQRRRPAAEPVRVMSAVERLSAQAEARGWERGRL